MGDRNGDPKTSGEPSENAQGANGAEQQRAEEKRAEEQVAEEKRPDERGVEEGTQAKHTPAPSFSDPLFGEAPSNDAAYGGERQDAGEKRADEQVAEEKAAEEKRPAEGAEEGAQGKRASGPEFSEPLFGEAPSNDATHGAEQQGVEETRSGEQVAEEQATEEKRPEEKGVEKGTHAKRAPLPEFSGPLFGEAQSNEVAHDAERQGAGEKRAEEQIAEEKRAEERGAERGTHAKRAPSSKFSEPLFGEAPGKETARRAPTEPSLFGEIEPPPAIDPEQLARAREAQRKRVKAFGAPPMILSILFGALVVAPVFWVMLYRFVDPPATLLMLQRAADGERVRHSPVPLSRISRHIVRSVIAAEDANFCAHDGFDFEAIQDAMERNGDGGRLRGASTISQQTAKKLFLWPSRSWLRKAFESYFTVLIETLWPKGRIMEAYLNAAEFGDGVFGIEAAARRRFGVSAARLTPMQAARLAAVLPSPNRYSAVRPGPYIRRQSATIMARARSVRASGGAACVLGS